MCSQSVLRLLRIVVGRNLPSFSSMVGFDGKAKEVNQPCIMWNLKFSFWPPAVIELHLSTSWHFDMFNPGLMSNQTFEIAQPSCIRCLFGDTHGWPLSRLCMMLEDDGDGDGFCFCLASHTLRRKRQFDGNDWWCFCLVPQMARQCPLDIEDSCCLRDGSV